MVSIARSRLAYPPHMAQSTSFRSRLILNERLPSCGGSELGFVPMPLPVAK